MKTIFARKLSALLLSGLVFGGVVIRLGPTIASATRSPLANGGLGDRVPMTLRLAPNPLSLSAGQDGTLTAILTPAPSRPGLLTLTSAVPGVATVPPSMLFAAGQTSISISVTAVAVGRSIVTAELRRRHRDDIDQDDSRDHPDTGSRKESNGRRAESGKPERQATERNRDDDREAREEDDDRPVTASVTVLVATPPPINHPPSVSAGGPYAAMVGQLLTFAGAASDSDGDSLAIMWDFGDGMTGEGLTPTHAYDRTGPFTAIVKAVDSVGAQATASTTVTVAEPPPPPNHPPTANAGGPYAGSVRQAIIFAGSASDPDNDALTFVWDFGDGGAGTGATSSHAYQLVGPYAVTLTVSDGKGGTHTDASTVAITSASGGDGNVPPDPSTVAPPLDATVSTPFARASEFLYTGQNPVQKGVSPGAIDGGRAAVVRGRVLDRAGAPLTGVAISVHDGPQFGSTFTRADGIFDIAVNGGGPLTIQYAKADFLPAQRQLVVPWQDFARAPDVVLVQLDSQVTTIDLAPGPVSVARGSVVTDADGTRQATLIFAEGGTRANLEFPDGSALTAQARLHVRATEYTVGANGRRAMPGELPPTSAYTYAVELTADEAISAGATRVTFDPPVAYYVENFLAFPVGGIAPVGFYNRDKVAWEPSENGRIIRIVSIADGVATVDSVGAGSLPALVINDAERRQLASLYQPGQTLWRVAIRHFSTLDINWPYRPDCDRDVQSCDPDQPQPQGDNTLEDGQCTTGSLIECQNQILRETLPITGTAVTLNYGSDRVPGRRSAYTLTIPLSGSKVPATLKRIDLVVAVAGQNFTQSFPGTADQRTTFTWNGRDAYGRRVQGQRPVIVRIGYVYGVVYLQPGEGQRSFAFLSAGLGLPLTANIPRAEVIFWQQWNGSIGPWDARATGLGGWTLNIHHAYDPAGKILQLGAGERRSARSLPDAITTAVGNGDFCSVGPCGDGGPAIKAGLSVADIIAVGPDGSVYIPDRDGSRIRRVGPNGIITTVAGSSLGAAPAFSGDGGLATSARLGAPQGVALGPDGSLYIADTGNHRVRRVGPDGLIATIAGNGTAATGAFRSPPGDGGPATQAEVTQPRWIAVGPDGSVYIADPTYLRIRRVSPDGFITSVAGTGEFCPSSTACGDGGPARQATFESPNGISLGPDGSLYIADTNAGRIRRIGPDGRISTVAGRTTGFSRGFGGDGGPAVDALFNVPKAVAVGPDNSLYIADQNNNRVRRVGPDGIITTIAGTGAAFTGNIETGFIISGGDGGPATQAAVFSPDHALIGPDGGLYIWGSNSRRVRKVAPLLPGFTAGDLALASEEGSEVYVFDNAGRHLRTLNALTGESLYGFRYDGGGLLEAVTDGDGNITTIERDGLGAPLAIVAPFGQRTTLGLDADGFLADISNPAAESVRFTSTSDGLLTSFTTARGNISRFGYDANGRLAIDTDAADGFKSLGRLDGNRAFSVTLSTALGRTTTYQVENSASGAERRVNRRPDGLQTELVKGADGTRAQISPDGTATSLVLGSDPRWGLMAPVATSSTTLTPGGLRSVVSSTRTATLTDAKNPLTLVAQNDAVSINGRTYTSAFSAATRTFTDKTPLGRQRSTTVDAHGRPVQVQVTGLASVARTYDGRGRLATVSQGTGVDARVVTLGYNSGGLVETITDPMARTVTLAHDRVGRLTTETLPDGRLISHSYDSNNNPTTITPPGRPAHSFSFTPVDLMSSYDPPDVGAGTNQTHYTYNFDRQLTREIRPDGRTIDFDYDTAGRLNGLTIARGAFNYSYDPLKGQLATIAAPDGIGLAYTYDGTLPLTTTWTGPVSGSVERTYDNDFRVTALTVGGSSISFAYDDDGLLTQAGALGLSRSPQNGLLTGTTLGNAKDTWTYNGFGEAAAYSASVGSTPLFRQEYTRDKIGRITQKVETIAGATDAYGYGYDLAGRLTTVTRNGATTAVYTYDANGNRLTVSTAAGTIAGTYNDQDRVVQYGSATYTYTGNGELHTKTEGGQTTTYQYDELGNLVSVALPGGPLITYIIDGNNRRIGKKVDGVLTQGFLYQDGLKPIAELDGANNIVSRFVYGTHTNVPEYMIKRGVTYRILTDQLGSPRLIVDVASAAVLQRMDFDEFGQLLNDTNPGFQPFAFAGGLFEEATKLVRFGRRDYDAETGRWTEKDPILFAGGDTNLYGYVLRDPLNLTDQSGLTTVQVTITLNGVFGFAWLTSYVGVAGDTSGHFGLVWGAGRGIGVGADIGAGVSLACSNAQTIDDLADYFNNVSVGIGLGPHGTIDGFTGPSSHGQVFGVGFTIGPGAGGGLSGGETWTGVKRCQWCTP